MVKRLLLLLLILFLAMQLYRPARTNPPVDASRTLETKVRVPPDVDGILDRACRDCHSSETRWPWYSHVAPLMWGVRWDVDQGRRHWNRSNWSFSTEEGADLLDEICTEVKRQTMPLPRYVWFHPDARLTQEDVQRLCAWTNEAIDELFAGQ
ncbi:MAG: cytochrome C [Luteitalea sp.]|nr:cytochrome C [Luteitalea sp.]